MIWTQSKQFVPVQNNLDGPKSFWTRHKNLHKLNCTFHKKEVAHLKTNESDSHFEVLDPSIAKSKDTLYLVLFFMHQIYSV